MALAALDLFGPFGGEAIIMASRLVGRSREVVGADRAEIAAVVEGLAEGAQYRRPPDAPTLLPHTGAGGSPGPTDKIG